MPASVTSATGAAGGDQVEHLGDACDLGVLVGDRHPHAGDAGVLQQPTGATGVLAADQRRGAQRLDRTRRQVAEVADRCGDEHQADAGTVAAAESLAELDHVADVQPPPAERAGLGLDAPSARSSTGMPSRWRLIRIVLSTTPSASR